MAGWNYRVIVDENDGQSIHEVHYDETGAPDSWVPEPAAPYGETHEELAADIGYMTMALTKPKLYIDESDDCVPRLKEIE